MKKELVIPARLFEMQDAAYRSFHSRLIPGVDPERIIGVRTPALRQFAKEIAGGEEARAFMEVLPHTYYEENNLHAFLIEQIADFDACIAALDAFLPFVDNWATCDMLSPVIFKRNTAALIVHIRRWLSSEHIYAMRFGVDMLMKHFLHQHFTEEHLDWVCGIDSEEYYLKMAVAWYFASVLTWQFDAALPYIKERKLKKWTHNKAIQKAVESRLIPDGRKDLLRSLKWK